MKPKIKKRGQKIVKRIERFSSRAKKGGEQHIREKLIARLPNARQVRVFILEWGLLVLAIISIACKMADIGYIHDMAEVISCTAERTMEKILEYICSQVSDMSIVVYSRSAAVHRHLARYNRDKFLNASGHRIV